MNIKTVKRAVKELEKLGLICVKRNENGGRNATNKYMVEKDWEKWQLNGVCMPLITKRNGGHPVLNRGHPATRNGGQYAPNKRKKETYTKERENNVYKKYGFKPLTR